MGGGRGSGAGFGKEGLISRLCDHFCLGFASSGWPMSFPRSFIPDNERGGASSLPHRAHR